jgi:hypothetical protein
MVKAIILHCETIAFIVQKLCFYGVKRRVLVRNWYKNMPFLIYCRFLEKSRLPRMRFSAPLLHYAPFVGW